MSNVPVELHFADGSVISAWESFTLRESFTDPLGSFDFSVQPPRDRIQFYRDKLQKGELVSLIINRVPQTVCLIQTLTTTVSQEGGVTFKMHCQNPLVTPYQGSVTPGLAIHSQTDIELTTTVLQALAPYGFTTVLLDNTQHGDTVTGIKRTRKGVKTNLSKLKSRDMQAHDDERAYAFCARLLTRLGVAIRMAWNGEIMIGAPDYDQAAISHVVQDSDGKRPGDRFFGSIEITDSNDDQFSECIVNGARVDSGKDKLAQKPKGSVTANSINPLHPPYKSTSASYKPLILRDKEARDNARSTSVAKLAMGLRAHKAYKIVGTVGGFVSKSGAIWSVDTIVNVFIEAAGINDDFWVSEREFSQSTNGGQSTRLTLLPKGALVLGDIPS